MIFHLSQIQVKFTKKISRFHQLKYYNNMAMQWKLKQYLLLQQRTLKKNLYSERIKLENKQN